MARLKLFIPLSIFIAIAAFLLRGLYLDPQALPSALIDKPLPDFELPTLEREELVKRQDLLGEVALYNVWATWCVACRTEHPFLNELADRGVLIYGINYKDDKQTARRWLANLGNPYRLNLYDSEGALGLDLGVYGAPETYFVDARGVIHYRHVGVLDKNVWKAQLQAVYQRLGSETPQ